MSFMRQRLSQILFGLFCIPPIEAYSFLGALDICRVEQGQYCYAWACSPENPERLAVLRLSFDQKAVISSSVLANSPREEAVGQACGGNKNRGAFFDLDGDVIDLLSDGARHEVVLEAFDPESKKYVALQSRSIREQGRPQGPVWFFAQTPDQGILVNAVNMSDLPVGVFGSANWHGADALVEFAATTHIHLDSRESTPISPDVTLLTSVPFYVFPERIDPWVMGEKLSVSVSLGVSEAERWNGGEVYVIMYTLWSDDRGHKFWFGWPLFDLRAVSEGGGIDDCRTCTGWPIVTGHADGGHYGHPAPDSARFMHFATESGPVRFTIQVTWQNFVNAVRAVLSTPGINGYPEDPASYRLEMILLNPEVFVGAPEAGGILDVRFSGLSIGIQ